LRDSSAAPDEIDFRALLEAAPGLYLILTPKLKIVGASDAYLRATMTVREEIVGRGLFEVFPDNPDDPAATGVANLRKSLKRVLRYRKPDVMAIQKYDVRGADGAFEERHWSPLNTPVLDAAGEVRWIIHRVEDVTEVVRLAHGTAERDAIAREPDGLIRQLRSANEELLAQRAMILEREAHMRSVLESSPDAIITIDARGSIRSFSSAAQKLFGYSAGEVVGKNVKMLMPEPYCAAHDGYLERYARTGERRIIGIGRQVIARKKDGTEFPIELAVGEVKSGQSHIFTGFIRDLTARTKLEEELRQSQKMEAIGQLTGGVAHDFNNLLTVISGNLELLEERLLTLDDRDLLREAQEATALGAQLAHRLLAFGRRQALNPKPIDLSELVGGTVDLLRRSLGESIEISTRLPAGLPITLADPAQVGNALLNLAINARDAMPNGGKLAIETALATIERETIGHDGDLVPGTYVTLAVTDTGTGMTPEVRSRAFEPFYTTKEVGAGSGLGLSMVYGFVKQSGGQVGLYTELGIGTTVRIYLPVEEKATQGVGAIARQAPGRRRTGERILVVEDQDRVRKVTARRLADLGYSVLEADSGPAALALLDRGEAIDLLFTDIVMPAGISGLELARMVRERLPDLKILFTSGFTEPDKIREGALTLNVAWIGKPYSTLELQERLSELLGG
jgi:PAS domain S-box-containing protein